MGTLANVATILAAFASILAVIGVRGIHKNTKTSNGATLGEMFEKHVKDDAGHFAAIESKLGITPAQAQTKVDQIQELKDDQ